MTIDRLIILSPVSIAIAVAALLAGIMEVMLINQTNLSTDATPP